MLFRSWTFNYDDGYMVGVYGYPDQQASIKMQFLAATLCRAAEECGAPEELQEALRNDVQFIADATSLVRVSFVMTCVTLTCCSPIPA